MNHSPARHVSALPSPISPVVVHTELSPIHSDQDSTADHTESHQSEGPSPPKQYVEVETPSPSVASLVEFAGNRASRTDLMHLVIVPHSPAVPFVAPVPPRSHRRTARRPRAHTAPSRPESPIPTPPSAAALSSSMTCSEGDARPENRASQAITSSKSKSEPSRSAVRPSFHDMFYIRDEMVVISVSIMSNRVLVLRRVLMLPDRWRVASIGYIVIYWNTTPISSGGCSSRARRMGGTSGLQTIPRSPYPMCRNMISTAYSISYTSGMYSSHSVLLSCLRCVLTMLPNQGVRR